MDVLEPPSEETLEVTPEVPSYTIAGRTPQPTTRKERRLARLPKVRVQAYELFIQGKTTSEIAKSLNVSRQYIYWIAKSQDWEAKRAALKDQVALQDIADSQVLELAVAELQSKISLRLVELDQLCRKGNIRAIELWLKLSGLNGRYEVPEGAKVVEVHNDLSDRRHVTVIQEGAPKEVQGDVVEQSLQEEEGHE